MTLDKPYAVAVYGLPAPKGSLKCIGEVGNVKHQLVDDEKVPVRRWRERVRLAGDDLRRRIGGTVADNTPVEVTVTLTLPRPKKHFRTGRFAHLLRDDAPPWPSRRGSKDDDKLARCVLDGLQDSQVFADDAQVVGLTVWKCYPDTPHAPDQLDRPGAVIRILPIES